VAVPEVCGVRLDAQTRCALYYSPLDITYRTRKEAEAAERAALSGRDRGINFNAERVALAERCRHYNLFLKLVAPDLSPATVARYEEHWRMQVAPTLGEIPVHALRPAHLSELYANLRTKPIEYRRRSKATGMRRCEIGALTWEAVDFERGAVAVRQAIGDDRRGKHFNKGHEEPPRAHSAARRKRH
jgi:integrase